MMLLDRDGPRTETYARAGNTEQGRPHALVPVSELESQLSKDGSFGVEVPNTVKVEELVPHFARLSLIGVAFPAFSDGRGFSVARRLRRAGFKGRLRAVGPLIADQFAYALACGFDEIELPEASAARQPFEQWQKAGESITLGYQRGDTRSSNILDQRRAARLGGRND